MTHSQPATSVPPEHSSFVRRARRELHEWRRRLGMLRLDADRVTGEDRERLRSRLQLAASRCRVLSRQLFAATHESEPCPDEPDWSELRASFEQFCLDAQQLGTEVCAAASSAPPSRFGPPRSA